MATVEADAKLTRSTSVYPPLPLTTVRRLRSHLEALYPPEVAAEAHERLVAQLAGHRPPQASAAGQAPFDETDVWLITYGDQITEPGRPPLQTLREFLVDRVRGVISGVHLLPHYPATSDDGFAVADYLAVDPALGSWEDVEALAGDFRLMLDAVVNHVSASNAWFTGWRAGDDRYADFFVTPSRHDDLSAVTRPRTSPLLTPVETTSGVRHVWTTFSADQVDLNYANPEVLLAMCQVLLDYVRHGARVLRLDAIAYLWKQPGTRCIHLRQTHEVIGLWRTMLDAVAPGTVLVTETNVPHAENVSYFGRGDDEAHAVYQFPLAPLILSAFHLADTSLLQEWIAGLSTPSRQTTFLNFLGSHDGVGLRPVEGLLTRAEINQLCELAVAHGGGVSYKTDPDGTLAPYELNTVFFDALSPAGTTEPVPVQVARFLCAESILLALAGVPAIYVQALLGSRNWTTGVRQTGRLRTINRRKFDRADLETVLADPASLRHAVMQRLCERIRVRRVEAAFHPAGAQRVVRTPPPLLAFTREAPDASSRVLCIYNLTAVPQSAVLPTGDSLGVSDSLRDLCHGGATHQATARGLAVTLPSYGVSWLREER